MAIAEQKTFVFEPLFLWFLKPPTKRFAEIGCKGFLNHAQLELYQGLLAATNGSSWIRRHWSDDVSLNDRYRLVAAGQMLE